MIKKLMYILGAFSMLCLQSCNDDDSLPNVTAQDRGTVTDNNGNTYNWVRIGDQLWTTSNACNGTPMVDKEYFNNFDWEYVIPENQLDYVENEYIPVFGNLMSYDDAIESAPEGWRLPSDEDWQKLERTLGMHGTDKKGWRGEGVAQKLQESGSGCELALGLGGSCALIKNLGSEVQNLDWVGEYGYYWTSTIDPNYEDFTMPYYRKIAYGVGKVSRECMRSESLLSVRWVKDVE